MAPQAHDDLADGQIHREAGYAYGARPARLAADDQEPRPERLDRGREDDCLRLPL